SREDFSDRHLIDRIVGTGIAAHEGQLFGWPNQLLGLATAVGLILLSVSGVILWWRRRESGVLGAPKVLLSPRVSWGLITLVVLLGIYLPLFGASLLLVLVIEWGILRRIPGVRRWLGLAST
ncbi:MAG: PepSY domain-containing protein, partial [Planctomycetota bacterium]|nr:PepSY domain-containing protein [Planctomycetota bacterium]